MATLYELLPDPAAIMSLEPEELAGLALELISTAGSGSPSRLHPTSFSSPDTLGAFAPPDRDQVARVMAEGWHWLVQEGFIAPAPGDTSGWHFVTRRGAKLGNRSGLNTYVNSVLLPKRLLHPAILEVCWSTFLRGEYDTAVFQAYRELEVAIRSAGGYTPDDYGVPLVRKAFHESEGPLSDASQPKGERESLAHLIAGALGSYKNAHSHRKPGVGVEEAVEMIVVASHLLKIVEVRGQAVNA